MVSFGGMCVIMTTVGAIQNVPHNWPLEVLLNTGSNGTMANFCTFDEGIHARTVPGTRMTGVHGGQPSSQETPPENIGFPDFLPMQRIPGPI